MGLLFLLLPVLLIVTIILRLLRLLLLHLNVNRLTGTVFQQRTQIARMLRQQRSSLCAIRIDHKPKLAAMLR